ncbi:hypothetical protein [Lentzea flaviverrucosa]|uniref:hypothetical protein n=1 Tax=Lentzea flaviverrucosa TaxID=200379 RepID=UPI0011600EE5|nr:hypothetical protein [Lentzea flaviverrucosa]
MTDRSLSLKMLSVRVLAVGLSLGALLFNPAPQAVAAVEDRHHVVVGTDSHIVDHSVEIWNYNTGKRVWRSDGKQLSVFRQIFTYNYTYLPRRK